MPPQESSVLFALDELRDIEEIRKRDQRDVARRQAKEQARIRHAEEEKIAAAAREVEREASELVQLRARREEDERSRRILEAQLAADAQTNASLQSRLRLLEAAASQPSSQITEQNNANRIHTFWALALVATLGAFMFLASQRSTPAPARVITSPQPVAALAPAADCPEPTPPAVVAPSLAPDEAPKAEPKASSRPPRRKGGDVGGKTPPRQAPIDISGCANDPLACMPE